MIKYKSDYMVEHDSFVCPIYFNKNISYQF